MLQFAFRPLSTTSIYTLSLHDALPIWSTYRREKRSAVSQSTARLASSLLQTLANSALIVTLSGLFKLARTNITRSEEHTSELQSRPHLVCRLLLEKKNIKNIPK